MTLTVTFDLHLENFNSAHNFLTTGHKAFIFGMCVPYDKTFLMVLKILITWPWPWRLTYIWITLTLQITFWVHLSRRLKCTIVITRCPSSVVHASVRLPSVVNFSHFRLLLWNRWTEFNETLTGSKISTSSTKFVFFGPIGKTRWPPWPLIGWDIFDFLSETA